MLATAGHELLDMVDDDLASNPIRVVDTRKFDQLSPRDVFRHETGVPDLADAIPGSMQYQGWRPDGRQDVADVNLAVHLHDGGRCARACRRAKIGCHAFGCCWVLH